LRCGYAFCAVTFTGHRPRKKRPGPLLWLAGPPHP
jgi:hypothetical protein